MITTAKNPRPETTPAAIRTAAATAMNTAPSTAIPSNTSSTDHGIATSVAASQLGDARHNAVADLVYFVFSLLSMSLIAAMFGTQLPGTI